MARTLAAAMTTLTPIRPGSVLKSEAARRERGYFVPVPTVAEIRNRHAWGKSWYTPRDLFIQKFLEMTMLKSPYRADKDGKEDAAYILPSGKTVFSVATFPFDVTTLGISNMAGRYAYARARASAWKHTPERMQAYDLFAQAVIDTWMTDEDLLPDMIAALMTTGWLVSYFPHDPARARQGKFPYDFQLLSPLGVYPKLDVKKRPIWVTIERKVTGAQLLQNYSMYNPELMQGSEPGKKENAQTEQDEEDMVAFLPPGLAELFEDEPDDDDLPEGSDHQGDRNNLLTSEFNAIRYFDDDYTALFIDASGITDAACRYNPTLAEMKKASLKGQHASVLHGSDHEDNPWRGVCRHNLGGIPMNFQFCWPDVYGGPGDRVSGVGGGGEQTGYEAGRLVGLPFLYSQWSNWRDLSRMYSMLNQMVLRAANPHLLTDADGLETLDTDILHVGQGEDARWMAPPPMSPEYMGLINKLEQQIERGSFGAAAYGGRAGSSARQQDATSEAGSIRGDFVQRKLERSLASSVGGVTEIMIARGGDEKVFAAGAGRVTGAPYTTEYRAADLGGVVPVTEVQILSKNGYKNPENIAMFTSALHAGLPQEAMLYQLLDEPNPRRIIEQSRAEAAEKDTAAMKPYVELAALEAEIANLKKKIELEQEAEDQEDEAELWKEKKRIEREMSQLPQATALQKTQETLMGLMQRAKLPVPDWMQQGQQPGPGQPPSGGAGGATGMPPVMGPGGTGMPPMPPSGAGGGGMPMPPGMGPGPGAEMMRPPMPMPMPMPMPGMMRPQMGPPGMMPPNMGGQYAKGPGQAMRPIPGLTADQPPGGVGRPGADSMLVGPGGLPGQLSTMPRIEAANRAVAPIGPLPSVTNAPTARGRRRGSRGRGRRK